MNQVIAIDGPAASGKSSVARRVAQQLGWLYVNTGNMFRAITLAVVRAGVDPKDHAAVTALNEQLQLDYQVSQGQVIISMDGQLVTDADLNAEFINGAVSQVAQVPAVRARLVAEQRAMVQHGDLVMEGRDIGSVIFPDTPLKFFITASEEVRRKRRAGQGQPDSIADRDKADSSRATAPMTVAEGAQVIDSSDMTLEQVVDAVLARVKG
jgi:CMP/dCMP kinase